MHQTAVAAEYVEDGTATHALFLSNLDLGSKHLTHKEPEAQRGTDRPTRASHPPEPEPFCPFPFPLQWLCPAGTGWQVGEAKSVDCYGQEVSSIMEPTLGIIGQGNSSLRLCVPSSVDGGGTPTCLSL